MIQFPAARASGISPCTVRRVASVLVVSAASWLQACGSSGGGDNPSPAPQLSVSGIIHKGRVAGASVCAYEVSNGAVGAQLGACVSSDAQGRYSISYAKPVDAVIVEARGGSYLDEATGVQTPLTVLRASSIPEADPNSSRTVYVTPITELVVRRALARGALSAESIKAASNEVIQYFKIGASSTEPTDLMSSGANPDFLSRRYGLYLAGISAQASGVGLPAVLNELTVDIANRNMASRNASFVSGVSNFLNSPRNASGITAAQVDYYIGIKPFGDPVPSTPVVETGGKCLVSLQSSLGSLIQGGSVCWFNVSASNCNPSSLFAPTANILALNDLSGVFDVSAGLATVSTCKGKGQLFTSDYVSRQIWSGDPL